MPDSKSPNLESSDGIVHKTIHTLYTSDYNAPTKWYADDVWYDSR